VNRIIQLGPARPPEKPKNQGGFQNAFAQNASDDLKAITDSMQRRQRRSGAKIS
jgi:hypothetical protein